MKFTVLMSTYYHDTPEELEGAVESLLNQTVKADEIIILVDGSIPPENSAELSNLCNENVEIKIYDFEYNRGLGLTLRDGLEFCSNEIIARMDSDDICVHDRFEKQINYLEEHPECDVVGSHMCERINNRSNTEVVRYVPLSDECIKKAAKTRNPFNHMTVMFRKSAVQSVEGYDDMLLFEDYYLWVKMIQSGFVMANLDEVLVYTFESDDIYRRRGGLRYLKHEINFQREIREIEYISPVRMAMNITTRTVVRIVPNFLRKLIYIYVLRKRQRVLNVG